MDTNSVRNPVVVVGAGPTGTVLAIELARRGIPVRIIEKRVARSMESRANGVQSRTLEIFTDLGIAGELVESGNRVGAYTFGTPRRRLFKLDVRRLDAPYPFMLIVPQHQTQRLLDRRLEELGVAIEWGVELTALRDCGGLVEVHTRDADGTARQFEAPYVIGCDGARSAVREQVGIPFEGADYGQDWLASTSRTPGTARSMRDSGRGATSPAIRSGRSASWWWRRPSGVVLPPLTPRPRSVWLLTRDNGDIPEAAGDHG